MKEEQLKLIREIIKLTKENIKEAVVKETRGGGYWVEYETSEYKIKILADIYFSGYLGSYLAGPFFTTKVFVKEIVEKRTFFGNIKRSFGKTTNYKNDDLCEEGDIKLTQNQSEIICKIVYDKTNPMFLHRALKKMDQDVVRSKAFLKEFAENSKAGKSNEYLREKYSTPESREWDRKIKLEIAKMKTLN